MVILTHSQKYKLFNEILTMISLLLSGRCVRLLWQWHRWLLLLSPLLSCKRKPQRPVGCLVIMERNGAQQSSEPWRGGPRLHSILDSWSLSYALIHSLLLYNTFWSESQSFLRKETLNLYPWLRRSSINTHKCFPMADLVGNDLKRETAQLKFFPTKEAPY